VYQRKITLQVRFEVVTKVTAYIISFWFVMPCARDRDRWRGFVNAVMNLRVPYSACGGFLDWLRIGELLKKDSATWSKYVSKEVCMYVLCM